MNALANFPSLAQLVEGKEIVDRASTASDHWLFLAALIVIMFAGSVAIRWLVTSLKQKDEAQTAERKEFQASREKDQAAFLHALDLKDQAVKANTKAVEALVGIVSRHDEDMRKAHELEVKTLIQAEIEKHVPPA